MTPQHARTPRSIDHRTGALAARRVATSLALAGAGAVLATGCSSGGGGTALPQVTQTVTAGSPSTPSGAPSATPGAPDPTPTPSATPSPSTTQPATAFPSPTATATSTGSAGPAPSASAQPSTPSRSAVALSVGDTGRTVEELQARLAQLDWLSGSPTGTYGGLTSTAVAGFQNRRGLPATGDVDAATWQSLVSMTATPSASLTSRAVRTEPDRAVDPRCQQGPRVICIDKTGRRLYFVQDGRIVDSISVRFGAQFSPTREGRFEISYKDADHVSSLYGSAMPFSMFFSRGQAVHYSSDFDARGYAGASHGCVNTRDEQATEAIFDAVHAGDPVIVYRSSELT